MTMRDLWNKDAALDIIKPHLGHQGSLLPILHDLQQAFGHIPSQAVPVVAEALYLSRAEVHGVVTFYHDFRERPAGARADDAAHRRAGRRSKKDRAEARTVNNGTRFGSAVGAGRAASTDVVRSADHLARGR